jgi:hypothetical protein
MRGSGLCQDACAEPGGRVRVSARWGGRWLVLGVNEGFCFLVWMYGLWLESHPRSIAKQEGEVGGYY